MSRTPGPSLSDPTTRAMPRRSVLPPVVDTCPADRCGAHGSAIPDETAPRGWLYVWVVGSMEPPRWYCSARCGGRGTALAELRMTPEPVGA
jgi:hypothetical protein